MFSRVTSSVKKLNHCKEKGDAFTYLSARAHSTCRPWHTTIRARHGQYMAPVPQASGTASLASAAAVAAEAAMAAAAAAKEATKLAATAGYAHRNAPHSPVSQTFDHADVGGTGGTGGGGGGGGGGGAINSGILSEADQQQQHHHQQIYAHAHAHATMLAHATQRMIQDHITSDKHAEVIHTQIQRHGDKHMVDLVLASVIIIIIMCGLLTLTVALYFGCISKSCRLIPLRYLCCPCLLLCQRSAETSTASAGLGGGGGGGGGSGGTARGGGRSGKMRV